MNCYHFLYFLLVFIILLLIFSTCFRENVKLPVHLAAKHAQMLTNYIKMTLRITATKSRDS